MDLTHLHLENFCASPSSRGFRDLPAVTKDLLVSFSRLCLHRRKGRQALINQIIYFSSPQEDFPILSPQYIKTLYRSIYDKGFAPPSWTNREYSLLIDEFGADAFVIAPLSSDPHDVVDLVRERVPVNIAMVDHFNKTLLEKYFGYKVSGYIKQWKRDKVLPPNIGIYTRTPIRPYRSESFEPFVSHVYNAIGYGFDSKKQPDWKAVMQHVKNPNKLRKVLRNLYKGVFDRIFFCANILRLTTIAMCYVGCGAFTDLYNKNGRDLRIDVWEPAFFEVHASHSNVDVIFLGDDSPVGYHAVGFIPHAFGSIDPYTTLYVNAWDPHSVPGNGNANDNSLDGQFGRRSAIGMLGWGLSNPKLIDNIHFYGT